MLPPAVRTKGAFLSSRVVARRGLLTGPIARRLLAVRLTSIAPGAGTAIRSPSRGLSPTGLLVHRENGRRPGWWRRACWMRKRGTDQRTPDGPFVYVVDVVPVTENVPGGLVAGNRRLSIR